MTQTWKLRDTGSLASDLPASHLKALLKISLSNVSLQELNRKKKLFIIRQIKVKETDHPY
jgi:hypothetical protein